MPVAALIAAVLFIAAASYGAARVRRYPEGERVFWGAAFALFWLGAAGAFLRLGGGGLIEAYGFAMALAVTVGNALIFSALALRMLDRFTPQHGWAVAGLAALLFLGGLSGFQSLGFLATFLALSGIVALGVWRSSDFSATTPWAIAGAVVQLIAPFAVDLAPVSMGLTPQDAFHALTAVSLALFVEAAAKGAARPTG